MRTAISSLLLLALLSPAAATAADASKMAISKVSEKNYRFTNGAYNSVFLVTDEGIVATDPIDADSAK